ncbi:MAG: response regulator [Myxococcales bacterium]|nr:response regulator [Myxococcales bacterium]MDP3503591.1 response regulator [Myxococcales bacterium]
MTIRALVVDDSLQLRRSVMYALQKLPDVVCVEAGDGAEALRKLRGSPFDIVLSDINMPVLDGLKLVAHIRQDAALSKLPVIMITTESAEADRERAMNLGANAYLVKPVQASEVVETVKSLLGLP